MQAIKWNVWLFDGSGKLKMASVRAKE